MLGWWCLLCSRSDCPHAVVGDGNDLIPRFGELPHGRRPETHGPRVDDVTNFHDSFGTHRGSACPRAAQRHQGKWRATQMAFVVEEAPLLSLGDAILWCVEGRLP